MDHNLIFMLDVGQDTGRERKEEKNELLCLYCYDGLYDIIIIIVIVILGRKLFNQLHNVILYTF